MPKICFEGGDPRSFLVDRKSFYSTLLPAVWKLNNISKSAGSGFCITEDGIIMTCAHCIADSTKIQLVNFDYFGTKTIMDAKVLKVCENMDIAMLQACPVSKKSFDFVTFAEDGEEICVGDEVHMIGSPSELDLSFISGRVAYPCKFNHDHMHKLSVLPRPYHFHASEGSRVEPFRVLDNVANNHGDISPHSKLHPQIPYIQVSHFFELSGCSGAPLFNNRGQVIGMFALGEGLCIHHLALKILTTDSPKDEGSSQGKGKRKRNRKRKKKC